MSRATKSSLVKGAVSSLFTLLLISSIEAKANLINLSDGDFNSADWQYSLVYKAPSYATISVGASQSLTGGDPGAYYAMATGHSHLYSFGVALYQNTTISYDPTNDGAILQIDYSRDIYRSGGDITLWDGLALWQNGMWFYSSLSTTLNSNTGWQNYTINNLTANDFQILGGGIPRPDFSSSGSPIKFGFYRATSLNSFYGGGGIYHGVDNWSVQITNANSSSDPIPEPGTVGLLGLGLAGLICFGRKRRYY